MDLVVIESPYAGDIEENVAYAKACVRDCLQRGESPYASHLFFTQEGILDDTIPEERRLGIEAGLAWGAAAKRSVVYLDRGISRGMVYGVQRAVDAGREIVVRKLYGEVTQADYDAIDKIKLDNWPAKSKEGGERNSVDKVLEEAKTELLRAEAKFARFNSRHEAYAVLQEEVDEMWDEVKNNDHPKARKEAVQVAAMALRYLRDF